MERFGLADVCCPSNATYYYVNMVAMAKPDGAHGYDCGITIWPYQFRYMSTPASPADRVTRLVRGTEITLRHRSASAVISDRVIDVSWVDLVLFVVAVSRGDYAYSGVKNKPRQTHCI